MSKEIERREDGLLVRDLVGTSDLYDRPHTVEKTVHDYEKVRPNGTVRERGRVSSQREHY
jgi:hypothetical protein